MKYFFIPVTLFMLFGCYYSNGCIYTPQMVNCYVDKGKTFPYIAQYQKVNSVGKTDSIQRWKDVSSCGGENKNNDISIKGERNKDMTLNINVIKIFENCMKSKGYIIFQNFECGTQNKEWDKGKCNL